MQWEGSLENRPRCQEWLLLIDAKVNAEKVEKGEAPLFEGERKCCRCFSLKSWSLMFGTDVLRQRSSESEADGCGEGKETSVLAAVTSC